MGKSADACGDVSFEGCRGSGLSGGCSWFVAYVIDGFVVVVLIIVLGVGSGRGGETGGGGGGVGVQGGGRVRGGVAERGTGEGG